MSDKVRGGHNSALAEGESLHDSSSDQGSSPTRLRKTSVSDGPDTANHLGRVSTGSGSSGHRPGSQSLPRFAAADVLRVEGARKVDSLPVNLRGTTHERDPSQERKRRAKGVMRSLGQFVQKVARQITSVSGLAKVRATDGVNSLRQSGEVAPTIGAVELDNNRNQTSTVNEMGGVAEKNDDAKRPGVVGIHNHGNTCYMNAVLQCLSNTERLLSYFVMNQYKVEFVILT